MALLSAKLKFGVYLQSSDKLKIWLSTKNNVALFDMLRCIYELFVVKNPKPYTLKILYEGDCLKSSII